MLKPRVGETVLASSPLMRFTIVVLPALSSPLHDRQMHRVTKRSAPRPDLLAGQSALLHEQQPDLSLLVLDLPDDRQQAHGFP